MSLKAATVVAIVGAGMAVTLRMLMMIARYDPSFAAVLYIGRGVMVNVLYIAIYVTFLIFFITLYRKQKGGGGGDSHVQRNR